MADVIVGGVFLGLIAVMVLGLMMNSKGRVHPHNS
jgi:hypothetical protein